MCSELIHIQVQVEHCPCEQTLPSIHHNITMNELLNAKQSHSGSTPTQTSHEQGVTISNDGATLMKLLDVVHPAAKILVDISTSQDAEVLISPLLLSPRTGTWLFYRESGHSQAFTSTSGHSQAFGCLVILSVIWLAAGPGGVAGTPSLQPKPREALAQRQAA